jgi:hypothetical protein
MFIFGKRRNVKKYGDSPYLAYTGEPHLHKQAT